MNFLKIYAKIIVRVVHSMEGTGALTADACANRVSNKDRDQAKLFESE